MSTVGIDLGNSNTNIATPDHQGNPVVMPNEVGELYTPSAAYFDGDRILVGVEALNALILDPSKGVINWKRHMGTDEVLCTGPDDKEYRARDIAAILLKHVAEVYAQKTGRLLSEAAVSVPANYTDRQKQETIKAGEVAGIEVFLTPHEPSAAGFGNKVHQRGDGLVLLLDLGGGTFDVSLLSVSGNYVEVKATNGDPALGGQDFNRRLIDLVLERLEEEHGSRPTREGDPVLWQDVVQRVEQVKLSLSARESAPLMLSFDGRVFSTKITRADLADRTQDLLGRAMDLSERTLSEAGVGFDQVREILRVGGASQMPCFDEAIEKRFGRKSSCHTEPFYAVVLGTMLLGRLEKERTGVQLEVDGRKLPPLEFRARDVTAHPIGVRTQDDHGRLVNSIILKKGIPIPSDHTRAYQLAEPGQTNASIHVIQGSAPLADDCELRGALELEGLLPIHDRPHQIDIRLRIDKNGMLTAEAYDPACGKRVEMAVQYELNGKKVGS